MSRLDPIARFTESYARAAASETFDAARAALATSGARGLPSVRFVLVKHWDERGFVVFTNLESRKARELVGNPHAALAFHWASIGEQVRVEGAVERVSEAEADAYFATRPRGAQLGAWASRQSAEIAGRAELEARVAEVDARFADRPVERPPFWSGFRVAPDTIEFWRDRTDRLHDRELFRRTAGGWQRTLLSP
jgi:pyridoxamine 5'-phosphate oxidase